ncbi:RNase HI [Leuconostoc holzapfelii]|uniref:RNase HI n=1 Tax=Leuconostoc holzapfelii TaxID=434464 RepID=A0ABT2NXK1_9LACO|nr:ribonuclease HI family protein [Leuconostoc holzapfelii]MCT8390098.1 RNase HI [Leuconostoc holzapfelii]
MLTLYVDAAREPNTGLSAAGAVLIHQKAQQQFKSPVFQSLDNHAAEFQGLIWALEQLTDHQDILTVYSDSKLLIEALHKHYAKHYQDQVDRILFLLASHRLVFSQWLPEKDNLGAHNLALQALKNRQTND